jgi:hypothetical protein
MQFTSWQTLSLVGNVGHSLAIHGFGCLWMSFLAYLLPAASLPRKTFERCHNPGFLAALTVEGVSRMKQSAAWKSLIWSRDRGG